MATTLTNFVRLLKAAFVGAGIQAANSVAGFNHEPAKVQALNGGCAPIDSFAVDFSTDAYAKHGAFQLTLTASTPITVDLTNTAGAATSTAGDTVFATINDMVFTNYGTQDVTVGAATTPFLGPLGGTTPTITIPAGATVRLNSIAGWGTVSGTNNNLKFNPGSGAAGIAVAIAGA